MNLISKLIFEWFCFEGSNLIFANNVFLCGLILSYQEFERRVDLIEDKIPRLPNVTSLVVKVHPICERHSFGEGVAGLLTRFNNLRYLCVQLNEVSGCLKIVSSRLH